MPAGLVVGGASGLSIGRVSPEAAEGGVIALVRHGDGIAIDIPNRSITLDVTPAELERRRREEHARRAAAWTPRDRTRLVSPASQAYAALTTSAARGAVRDVGQLRFSNMATIGLGSDGCQAL